MSYGQYIDVVERQTVVPITTTTTNTQNKEGKKREINEKKAPEFNGFD